MVISYLILINFTCDDVLALFSPVGRNLKLITLRVQRVN